MEVKIIEGDDFQQIQVSTGGDTPDPRVVGPKIIFDSRLDKFSKGGATEGKDIIK